MSSPLREGSPAADKRRHPRQTVDAPIRLRILGGRTSGPPEERSARMHNFSLGGLLVSTDFPIAPETLVELQIPNQTLGYTCTMHGKIRWHRAGSPSGDHEAGICFVRLAFPKCSHS